MGESDRPAGETVMAMHKACAAALESLWLAHDAEARRALIRVVCILDGWHAMLCGLPQTLLATLEHDSVAD